LLIFYVSFTHSHSRENAHTFPSSAINVTVYHIFRYLLRAPTMRYKLKVDLRHHNVPTSVVLVWLSEFQFSYS